MSTEDVTTPMIYLHQALVESGAFEDGAPLSHVVNNRVYTFRKDGSQIIDIHIYNPAGGVGDFCGLIDVRECINTTHGSMSIVKAHLKHIIENL